MARNRSFIERRPLSGRSGKQAILAGATVEMVALLVLAGCALPFTTTTAKAPQPSVATPIKHVIIIMQENRSFDTYFGTYPGADGIPMRNGVPTVCVSDPPLPMRQTLS